MIGVTDRRRAAALAAALIAAVGSAALWGFTVDDALISARVAHHLAAGVGYRFNPAGPVVDAVTPLGYAWLLMPFAKDGVLPALEASRAVGVVAWVLSAAWLGARVAALSGSAARFLPLLLVGASFPLAAWSVAGMETALVVALATLALGDGPWAAAAAGVAAAWRPELIPWAVAISVGGALVEKSGRRSVALMLLLAVGPSVVVAATRAIVFGHAAPLAVFAKPSTTDNGLYYAAASLIWSGPPALWLAGRSWMGVTPRLRVVAVASGVHVVAIVGAGGDWMPYARLLAPALPGMLLVASAIAGASSGAANALRLCLALAPTAVLAHEHLDDARSVWERRLSLAAELRHRLPHPGPVAAVDVGWVGLALDGEIVDLAGVADHEVAMLPGGHIDKRIPDGFLARRGVTHVVLQVALPTVEPRPIFVKPVARRIAFGIQDLTVGPENVMTASGPKGPHYLVFSVKASPEPSRIID